MPGDSPTVAEILRHQARSGADHPLLVCDGDRISYAEADRRSAELARGLIAQGAGKGTHVGLLYPNGTAFVVGMLAVVEITLAGYLVTPAKTQAFVQLLHDWARAHRRKVLVAMFAVVGVALVAQGMR